MTSCKVYSFPNNKINSISFSLLCHKGAMSEQSNEQGITHLIEHLCFHKAGELNQSQIYHLAESKGVNILGKTGKNYVELSFSCRREVFDDLAKLVSKMWFELDYSADDVDIEKKVIFREIATSEPTNAEIILGKVWHNVLLDCNVLGTEQTLQAISREQIVNYKRSLLSADTSIVVAGNFSEDNLATIQNELVNKFAPTAQSESKFIKQTNTDDKLVVVKDKYTMADVYYSLHTTIGNSVEKFVAILTLDDLLFRGNAGYVAETLRDKFGYIYEIHSRVDIVNGEVGWIVRLSCHKNDVCQVIDCMESLLKNFVLTDNYLQYTKAFYCDNLPMLLDRPNVICDCITNGLVAINQAVTLHDFAQQCQTPNSVLYKQLLGELLADKHVYVFGNISRQSTKILKKTLCQ